MEPLAAESSHGKSRPLTRKLPSCQIEQVEMGRMAIASGFHNCLPAMNEPWVPWPRERSLQGRLPTFEMCVLDGKFELDGVAIGKGEFNLGSPFQPARRL